MKEDNEIQNEKVEVSESEINNSVFDYILDKDEKILKVYKPNKKKMFWSMWIANFFVWAIWTFLVATFSIASAFGEQKQTANGTEVVLNGNAILYGFLIGFVCLLILFTVVIYLFFKLSYKNTFYAYSNKRVIIRKGIFGVDYKSLDMSMIGAMTVNVSLLDKIVAKNTGSIIFGSVANPISPNVLAFSFANILDPYNVYKEIKSIIDEKKIQK